ncbi:MAG: 2-C-methyl-D-erythritol 4-phosphate cytidylyltransferase [Chloroflexi bacterium]|nr:2-C-methyl-D-erythritol 4-phosphate cytidylyltransferase [Chloroflexota bacterium]
MRPKTPALEVARQQVGAVIAAAGRSQRMEGENKIFAIISGRPLLHYVVNTFQRCAAVRQVVVVLSPEELERGQRLMSAGGWSKVALCVGGKRRQDSVYQGLKKLDPCQWVIIHDGARPLVTTDLIERGLAMAQDSGAAIAAVPVIDTIKKVDDAGFVLETPSRPHLWAAQTPQIFRWDIISRAYEEGLGEVTDDAALVEQLGYRVKVYPGSYQNIKVTTVADLKLAGILLKTMKSEGFGP